MNNRNKAKCNDFYRFCPFSLPDFLFLSPTDSTTQPFSAVFLAHVYDNNNNDNRDIVI